MPVRLIVLLTVCCALHLPVAAQSGPVIINEFMAANETSVPEMADFGDYEDWIELLNSGSAAVDLAGYSLTDDQSEPGKWTFPPASVVEPGGFFLVWADGADQPAGMTGTRPWWPGNLTFSTRWNHASFSLSRDGEGLFLFDDSGVLMDSVTFGEQWENVSLGRMTDGTWRRFAEPTPLAPNLTTPLEASTEREDVGPGPGISPQGGTYDGAVTVSLSANSGDVYYSLDGSRPSSGSYLYSGPFEVSSTTVVRARVIPAGGLPGIVSTSSYEIGGAHQLPIVSVATDPDLLWDPAVGMYLNSLKEREIPISIELIRGGRTEAALDAGARIGGENIFRFAQKPLNIYFRGRYGSPELSYQAFDSLPYASWKRLYLRNGGDDWPDTMFRDGLQGTIISGFMENSVQAYRPTVLYLNGQYWGLTNLREKLDNRYFLLHYGVEPSDLDHLESTTRVIEGDSTDFVDLLAFTQANDLRVEANYDVVANQIDVTNLIDFVIAQSFFANTSWGHNREVWRDRSGDARWRWVLVDMDRGYQASRIATDILPAISRDFDLFNRLLRNETFRVAFLRRFALHLNTTFTASRSIAVIDSLAESIRSEIPAHAEKWGPYVDSLSIPQWGIEAGIQSLAAWERAVDDLRSFAIERPSNAVRHVVSAFGLPGSAQLAFAMDGPGHLTVDEVPVRLGSPGPWFETIPLRAEALARPGFRFRHWIERASNSQVSLVSRGSEWRYLDGGAAAPAGWTTPTFHDSGWASGPAQLGYGDGDEATVVSFGPDSQNKAISTYFRATFDVQNPAAYDSLVVDLVRDDGAAVYLNGVEIVRSNLPGGVLSASTTASSVASSSDESRAYRYRVDPSHLVSGSNVVAVEVHQVSGQSSDISFDLGLVGYLKNAAASEVVIGSSSVLEYVPEYPAEIIAVFEPENVQTLPSVIESDLQLTAAESPYVITGSVVIEDGATLTVGPGTTLRFADGAAIHAAGSLQFLGSAAQPVRLEAYYEGEPWGAICATNTDSVFEHVWVSGAVGGDANCPAAISVVGGSSRIAGGAFSDVHLPIYSRDAILEVASVHFEGVSGIGDYITADGGQVTIDNSTFVGNDLLDMDAIDLGLLTPGSVVSDNVITGFSGLNSDGIDLGEGSREVRITGNIIADIADKGVSIGQGSSALVSNNVIARTLIGIGVKDSLSVADVRRTTFWKNGTGVAVFEKNPGRGGASATVRGSLFTESATADVSADHLSSIDVEYSLSDGNSLPGANNTVGEPALLDPDRLNMSLQVQSAAIDAGDPSDGVDPDGSPPDAGAFSFAGFREGAVIINEINYHSASEFDTEDWIELYNRSDQPVALDGWTLVDSGLTPSTRFEEADHVGAGEFAVLSRDQSAFALLYPTRGPLVGGLANGLGGDGDALYLYDAGGVLVDSVAYLDGDPWPALADGSGPTLELMDPGLDNAAADSWLASAGYGTPGASNSVYGTGVGQAEGLPATIELLPNYPNPFNPTTVIPFALPEAGMTNLAVFDVLGRRIDTLVDGFLNAGRHQVSWDAKDLPSGTYFLKLSARRGRLVRTVVLAK